ncbi:MAG: SDR family NAD(P)-dependent oxidoreductase [Lachnospiraceae bacterium]|nr:SDR family NAD(P)-dependent oxidoreductase [Lachnospiraceae bacterium]
MKRKTAVITGATSSIGREFALAFAAKGYRLVLTGRRENRLKELADSLGVPCRIWRADLSVEEECRGFLEKLENTRVDVFINNAGFGVCGSFADTELSKEISLIDVNVKAMHILFKGMLQKMEKQGHGAILNVGSAAGLLPAGPHMAAYYASKAYVVSLTRAAARELKEAKSPVYVAVLCPGPVDTEFNARANVTFAMKGISPKYCVREAFRGMKKRQTVIIPSPVVRMGTLGQRFLPSAVLLPLISVQQKRKVVRAGHPG